jgi:hypothetical protein
MSVTSLEAEEEGSEVTEATRLQFERVQGLVVIAVAVYVQYGELVLDFGLFVGKAGQRDRGGGAGGVGWLWASGP